MRLCLIRHGQTEENQARILQGHLPGVLSEQGREEAMELRGRLDLDVFDVILSSDLKRVRDTVDILLDGRKDIPWIVSRDLREVDWGSMTGMKIEDIRGKALAKDVETREMLYERAGHVWSDIRRCYPGRTVMVVSHGLFLRSLLAHINRIPIKALSTITYFGNCEARWIDCSDNAGDDE